MESAAETLPAPVRHRRLVSLSPASPERAILAGIEV